MNIGHCASFSCVVSHPRFIRAARRNKSKFAYCGWCGGYLPLGKAKDTKRVKQEIRAMEIALAGDDQNVMTGDEFVGYCSTTGVVNPLAAHMAIGGRDPKPADYETGQLAHVIVDHV